MCSSDLLNDDARTTASMAANGFGIGIIPSSALPLLENADVIHKKLTNSALHSKICLLQNPSHYVSISATLFEDYFRSIYISTHQKGSAY